MNGKPTMRSVKRQFKYWREHGKKKNRVIPDRLWAAAVCLTEEHSINHVAKSLKLNNTTLRDRVAELSGLKKRPVEPACNFVEVSLEKAPSGIAPGYEVELEDPRGRKMFLRGGRVDALVEAAKSVWDEGV